MPLDTSHSLTLSLLTLSRSHSLTVRPYCFSIKGPLGAFAEILALNKTIPDITWLNDKSLIDLAHLPGLEVRADEIIKCLGVAIKRFREFAKNLNELLTAA